MGQTAELMNFDVSQCIFQLNNRQTPTQRIHIRQYISLEC